MNTRTLLIISALLIAAGCNPQPSAELEALQSEVAALRAQAGPPPASLDQFYPPQAPAPVYQIRMHELNGPLAGLVTDLMEGDLENVPGHYEAFRTVYQEVGALVPEWQDRYPMAPVDELGAALEGGDQAAIMAAVEGVGAVCHDCHVQSYDRVQLRYQWPSFADVRATDPVDGVEVTMAGYMRAMETSFGAIGVSLQQGQLDRARDYFDAFHARFGGLADLCTNCHDTEREYFIDEEVQRIVRAIGSALETDSPDPAAIGGLMQRVGNDACHLCHRVHTPAAMHQYRWSEAH